MRFYKEFEAYEIINSFKQILIRINEMGDSYIPMNYEIRSNKC